MSRAADRVSRPVPRVSDELTASILDFLAADEPRFDRFLSVTGLAVPDLRTASRTSGFGENLLDYLSSDEALLLAFAAESGRAPAELAQLREAVAAAHDSA